MNIIGHEPAVQTLTLIDGQDLSHLFTTTGPPLPTGSVCELRVTDRDRAYTYGVWPITATEDGWLLNIEADDHANIPTGARYRIFATYPTGQRACWIAGPVSRSRR